MGCTQSKVDNEESVTRCKERRNLMKEAVAVRNAFASAHSSYAVSLKDTGATLSDYAQGEVPHQPPETTAPTDPSLSEPPPPPPLESTLPPPPPPLPTFSLITPLQRVTTMPAALSHSQKMKGKINGIDFEESKIFEEEDVAEEIEELENGKLYRARKDLKEIKRVTPVRNPVTPPEIRGMAWNYFFMDDNMQQPSLDDAEEERGGGESYLEEEISENHNDQTFENFEFKTPEKKPEFDGIEEFKTPEETPVVVERHFVHSAPPAVSRMGVMGKSDHDNGVDLLKILSEIDDHFLKATESAHEVSKMLAATRLHYHSDFADNRGQIDHAAQVMQVITWNKLVRSETNGEETKNNHDAEDFEVHATILDKLLAWEKKLYEEVKTGELMKREYQRKVSVLNKLKKRNASSEQLEKAKAAVSHLHTRYIVDMQSLDSTVSEVNDIRDKQLYPKLVSLVQGMAKMWDSMCSHHENQLRIVTNLKALDVSGFLIETTKHNHERTKKLSNSIDKWNLEFEKLVTNQRHYIGTLNSWLKLNPVPIESTLKEKVLPSSSSPPRVINPPIQPLLFAWHDILEKLPDEVAKSAIASFAAVIKAIIVHQDEEMKLKERYEETRREYLRKKQGFGEWYQKYMTKRTPPDEANEATNNVVSERQFVVESLKKKMEEEFEEHQKHCVQVREKSLGNLKIRLPELFRALSDYARACFNAYERLRLLDASK